MIPTVLVTQPLPESLLAPLVDLCQLEVLCSGDSLATQDVAKLHGLICLLTDTIDSDLIDAMPQLAFVSSVSVGVDHVDVSALTTRGIPLGHTPGVLVDTTADLAFALLLSAARRLGEADRFIRGGNWLPQERWSPNFFLGKEVSGATLGIVGLGDIGQAVARRASGFGMQVLAWTPSGRQVPGVTSASLQAVLSSSDFVSVHVALSPDTHDLIDAAAIAAMKPGSVLINTARGGIVDEQALASALDSGHLYAAGLDVYAQEPLPLDSPLLSHPRVVLAPHIGSATTQTRLRMVELAVANAVAALQGQPMPHCFNPQIYG
ncbi:MAG: glyoxylate reductase [Bacteroidia bacterium]|jgi:glyoxylate reductase